METKLTKRDLKTCGAAQRRCERASDRGEYDGPETVMLSTGYADVWLDGEVTQHGVVIVTLDV